ncbi:MAG TPA: TetR/AcrR family transcriptional regulator [Candidatus Limnocylindrales bacterium]|nr:TetR/AcrR family transcriptional regulator [Candidatus Limnocylindrales bacterium]
MGRPGSNTRHQILNAAEHAFGERGFDGASLRDIVCEAKVNLATVYYYFGSKHGLMEAVLARRFGPLRQEQFELLQAAEKQQKGRAIPVDKILRALLLPPLRLLAAPEAKRQTIARLVGRIVTEPNTRTQAFLRSQHGEVRAAFLRALQTSLPKVPPAYLRWRFEFITGALAIILCNPTKLQKETRGVYKPIDVDRVLVEMIRFFSPGFHVPNAHS